MVFQKRKFMALFLLTLIVNILSGCSYANNNTPANYDIKTINIVQEGQEEIVFSADDWHCPEISKYGKMDVPDAPVRAVRLKDGKVVVFAAHYNNLVFRDVQFSHFKRTSCESSLVSAEDPDPNQYSDHEWVISPYTEDGNKIFGLIHNEYWGGLYDFKCRLRLGLRDPWNSVCLYANITSSTSVDAGKNFVRSKPENRVVASIQYPFSSDMNRVGTRDPSNIFLNPVDNKVYFLASVDNYLEQKSGMCLFQNDSVNKPIWHVWDGVNFDKSMSNPYIKNRSSPVTCEPILDIYVSGVVYHQKSGLFIGIAADDKAHGIFYVTSKDLIHWSNPKTIYPGKSMNGWHKGDLPPIIYASIIDEKSISLNYDTVSDNAYIYFIRVQVKEGKIQGRERDIVKIPIHIEYKD
jgi:hypothetical protein